MTKEATDDSEFLPEELRLLWDESFTPTQLGGLTSIRGLYYQYLYSLALARELLKEDAIYQAYACEWIEDFLAWGEGADGHLAHVLLVQVKTALSKCFLQSNSIHRVFRSFEKGIDALRPHVSSQTKVRCRLVYNPQLNHDCKSARCVERLQNRPSYRAFLKKISAATSRKDVNKSAEFVTFLPIPITRQSILDELSFLNDEHQGFTDLLQSEKDLTTFLRVIYGLVTPLYVPRMGVTEPGNNLQLAGLHRNRVHARDDIEEAISAAVGLRQRVEGHKRRQTHVYSIKQASTAFHNAKPTKKEFLRPEATGITFVDEKRAKNALAVIHTLANEKNSIVFDVDRFQVLKLRDALRIEIHSDAIPISDYLRRHQPGHLERVKLLMSFMDALVSWTDKGVVLLKFRPENPEYKHLYLVRPQAKFTMGDIDVLTLSSTSKRLLDEEWLAAPLLAKAVRYLYYGKMRRREIENTRIYRAAWNDNVVRDFARWLDSLAFVRINDVRSVAEDLFKDELEGWPLIFSRTDDQFIFDTVDLGYKYSANVLSESRMTTLSEDRGHYQYPLLYTSWRNAQIGSFEEPRNVLNLYRYTEYDTRRWASARDRDRNRHKAIEIAGDKERFRVFASYCEEPQLQDACLSVFGLPYSEYLEWFEGEKYRAKNIPKVILPPILARERNLFEYRRGRLDALRNKKFTFETLPLKRTETNTSTRTMLIVKGSELVNCLDELGYRQKMMRSLSAKCTDLAGRKVSFPLFEIRLADNKILLDVLQGSEEVIPNKGTFHLSDEGTRAVIDVEDSVLRQYELSLATSENVGPELAAGRAWSWLEPIFGRDRPPRASGRLVNTSHDNLMANDEIKNKILESFLHSTRNSYWQVLTGAAGTGKTRVTASIAFEYLERTKDREVPPRRVLVISAAHFGVDNFVRVFRSVSGGSYVPYRFVTNSRVVALTSAGVVDPEVYDLSKRYYEELETSLPQPRTLQFKDCPFVTYRENLEAQLKESHRLRKSRKPSRLFLPSHYQWQAAYTKGTKWITDHELNTRRRYLQNKLEQVNLYEESFRQQLSNYSTSSKRPSPYAIFASDIIATTADGFDRLPDMNFDLIVVEEASQLGVLKLLTVITKVARARDTNLPPPNILLSGDQRQLAPFLEVNQPDANYRGADKQILDQWKSPEARADISQYSEYETAFETICRRHPNRVFPLTTQYRMHQEIAALVNRLFYGEQTWTVARKRAGVGVVWIDTAGLRPTVDGEKRGTSKFNQSEIRVVSDLVRNLLSPRGQDQILVISPYSAQVSKIDDQLKEIPGLKQQVKVRTIDGCQGIEANIVIVSFVSLRFAPGRDFVVNPKRMNVALSRARDSLYLVGNFSEISASIRNLRNRSEYRHVAEIVDSFAPGGPLNYKLKPAR